ncbi:hypothetical protein AAGN28_28145, partial [Klebsiella pneumoniae]
TVCVVGKMRDLILQLSKSSIYSTKPTWRDPPDWLDGILLGVIEFGVLIAGIIFFVWGIGYKLAFWGQHDPNTIYASANDVILPNLALGTGVLIAAWVYIRYLKR